MYNFSAICRLFRSEAPPNQWGMVSNEMETHSSSQWLMFFEKEDICTFINPRFSQEYFMYLPKPLLGCVVYSSMLKINQISKKLVKLVDFLKLVNRLKYSN